MRQAVCSACSEPLVDGKAFCSSCGARVSDNDTISTLKLYVNDKIAAEISEKLMQQRVVVREMADDAEDVLMKKLKNYGFLLGFMFTGALGLFVFFGYKTYSDFSSKTELIVKSIESGLTANKESIANQSREIASTQASLDELSSRLSQQIVRVEASSGEISQKLKNLDEASQQAEKTSREINEKIISIEKQVEAEASRLASRVQQVTAEVDSEKAQEAFPGLGEIGSLFFNGKLWKGRKDKQLGEKWVNISVNLFALSTYKRSDLERFEAIIRSEGAIPLPGNFTLSGPTPVGDYIALSQRSPAVVYFDEKNKNLAENLAKKAEETFGVPFRLALFSSVDVPRGYSTQMVPVFEADSGIDIEVVLAPH